MKQPSDEQTLDRALKFTGCFLALLGILSELDGPTSSGGLLVAGVLLVIASYLRRILRLLEHAHAASPGNSPAEPDGQ